MQNRQISVRNAVCVLVTMSISSMQMSGIGMVGQDMWITVIAAVIMVAPFIWIFARINAENPGLGLYDIVQQRFSKLAANIIIVLILWYALHITSLVTRNFTEFITFISLPRTPRVFLEMGMIMVSCYLATCDVWSIGRWSMVILVSVVLIFIATFFLSLRSIDLENLKPVLEHSLSEVFSTGFSLGAIAFGETVLLLVFSGKLSKSDSAGRVYVLGIAYSALILISVLLRDILVLGKDISRISIFPSYITARIISPGKFLEHMESIVSYYTLLLGITKCAVCIKIAALGMAHISGKEKGAKRFIIPSGLIALAVCALNFDNFEELLEFGEAYRLYSLLFFCVIPVIVLIKSKYQNIRAARKNAASDE